jgi:membrane-associated protease RseP (regulator of RpoE activity)
VSTATAPGTDAGEPTGRRGVLAAGDATGIPSLAPEPAGPAEPLAHGPLILLGVVAAIAIISARAGVGKTVLVVAALLVMIVLHEFGHFLMAKWADMKVTEYFVGFGPRLWSFRRGETEFGVKALPLGGYVKIIGMNGLEEVAEADEARTYRQKPFWRQLSVGLAGSAMHFLIAFVLLVGIFWITGDDGNLVAPPANAPIMSISKLSSGPSPAEKAGLEVGDRIEAIDGHHFASFDAQRVFIVAHAGVPVSLTVDRHGRTLELRATPVNLRRRGVAVSGLVLPAGGKPYGFLGIEPSPVVHYGFFSSVNRAADHWVDLSARTLHAFADLVSVHGVTGQVHMLVSQKAADTPAAGTPRFHSVVGIVQIAHTAASDGFSTVLYFLVLVNIAIGIFNLLPFPPLDGGHVVLAVYERLRSRSGRRYRADATKWLLVAYGGVALVVIIGASALFLDLRDLIS